MTGGNIIMPIMDGKYSPVQGSSLIMQPASNGDTMLHIAAKLGDRRVLDIALATPDLDVDVRDRKRRTALHLASAHRRHGLAAALLQRGAALDPTDENGDTPLHLAVLNGDYEMVCALLEHAGSRRLDTLNRAGHSALYIAIYQGLADSAAQLIIYGAAVPDLDFVVRDDLARVLSATARLY